MQYTIGPTLYLLSSILDFWVASSSLIMFITACFAFKWNSQKIVRGFGLYFKQQLGTVYVYIVHLKLAQRLISSHYFYLSGLYHLCLLCAPACEEFLTLAFVMKFISMQYSKTTRKVWP